jgi:hypothetical protein
MVDLLLFVKIICLKDNYFFILWLQKIFLLDHKISKTSNPLIM